MKRIALVALALTAVCAFSGATASVSVAGNTCVRNEEPNAGSWTNATCTEKQAGQQRNWVKIQGPTAYLGQHQWCAEVELVEEGTFKDPFCLEVGAGKFAKVLGRPAWWLKGEQLKQGTRQIKLQLKSAAAILKSATLGIEISCKGSGSEGATIEGNGLNQGQGKGRVTYSQCTVLKPAGKEGTCEVAQPITTNQLKSHLATANVQSKIVTIFEPTVGKVFVELKFTKPCGEALSSAPVGVTGSVAGEDLPSETEGQEGMVVFPSTAISKVNHEGQERTLKLETIGNASTFTGVYSARLQNNEQFGVFGSN